MDRPNFYLKAVLWPSDCAKPCDCASPLAPGAGRGSACSSGVLLPPHSPITQETVIAAKNPCALTAGVLIFNQIPRSLSSVLRVWLQGQKCRTDVPKTVENCGCICVHECSASWWPDLIACWDVCDFVWCWPKRKWFIRLVGQDKPDQLLAVHADYFAVDPTGTEPRYHPKRFYRLGLKLVRMEWELRCVPNGLCPAQHFAAMFIPYFF